MRRGSRYHSIIKKIQSNVKMTTSNLANTLAALSTNLQHNQKLRGIPSTGWNKGDMEEKSVRSSSSKRLIRMRGTRNIYGSSSSPKSVSSNRSSSSKKVMFQRVKGIWSNNKAAIGNRNSKYNYDKSNSAVSSGSNIFRSSSSDSWGVDERIDLAPVLQKDTSDHSIIDSDGSLTVKTASSSAMESVQEVAVGDDGFSNFLEELKFDLNMDHSEVCFFCFQTIEF